MMVTGCSGGEDTKGIGTQDLTKGMAEEAAGVLQRSVPLVSAFQKTVASSSEKKYQ